MVVALSEPNETRSGSRQFPAVSRLPDGRLLLMYADAEDMSETHARRAPAFVSSDEGAPWALHDQDPPVVRPHYTATGGQPGLRGDPDECDPTGPACLDIARGAKAG